MMKDTTTRLSHLSIALHWIVGLTMIGLIAVGTYMHRFEVYALYPIHKSIGIVILAFVLLRILWRMSNGWPESVSAGAQWEHRLAKLVHWVLIIGTLVFPISGMMMSGAGGHGLFIFDLELLARNVSPDNPEMVEPLNEMLASIGRWLHGFLANLMMAAIALHIIGALKHHFVDKDGPLRRMLGRTL